MAEISYDGYEDWKGWSDATFMQPFDREWRLFDAELAGLPLAARNVLDIGFGNGTFLAWAEAQGATVYGAEISHQAVALAEARGVVIVPADLAQAAERYPARFDVIAAFDVLEHLTRRQIDAFVDDVARMLRPGGRFIARFPNGQSPFGRSWQHGDATHITVLSAPIFTQLIAGKPFAVLKAGDPRLARHGPVWRRIRQSVRDLARRGVERGITGLFGVDTPMDSNTIVLLERA